MSPLTRNDQTSGAVLLAAIAGVLVGFATRDPLIGGAVFAGMWFVVALARGIVEAREVLSDAREAARDKRMLGGDRDPRG